MPNRGGDPQPAYMLHHDLHMTWGQARLNYWLFSFRPIYERAAIFDRLAAVLHEHGITSYFAYELLGHYDILLRAWVPKSLLTSDLEDALSRGLSSGLAATVDIASLEVAQIVRHWMWIGPDGNEQHPDQKFIQRVFTTDYLKRLNATVALNDHNHLKLSDAELLEAIDHHILLPYPPLEISESGIKFAMFVATEGLSYDQRRQFKRVLREKLDAISQGQNEVKVEIATELALYYTPNSRIADFLIIGRISTSTFYPTLQILIDFITDPYQPLIRARPTTHILARVNFSIFREGLPSGLHDESSSEPDRVDVRELLDQVEHSTLEFKASVIVDYQKWLFSGGEFEPKEELFFEGIVRTIAAFLNSPPYGGTLVVGALERNRVIGTKGRHLDEAVRARLEAMPQVGQYFITGIQADIDSLSSTLGRGIRDDDSLMTYVSQRLESAVGQRVVNGRVYCEIASVEGKSLIVFRVRPSGPKLWAYFRDTDGHEVFAVRVGGRTKRLDRADADEYKDQWR